MPDSISFHLLSALLLPRESGGHHGGDEVETVHLAADQLASVERFDKRGILWKTFGYQSGALRWGRFWSRQLGTVHAYTAGRAPLVLVRLHGQPPVLLSPGDTAGFIAAVWRIIEDRDTRDPA